MDKWLVLLEVHDLQPALTNHAGLMIERTRFGRDLASNVGSGTEVDGRRRVVNADKTH
jgi:hypothetical protein